MHLLVLHSLTFYFYAPLPFQRLCHDVTWDWPLLYFLKELFGNSFILSFYFTVSFSVFIISENDKFLFLFDVSLFVRRRECLPNFWQSRTVRVFQPQIGGYHGWNTLTVPEETSRGRFEIVKEKDACCFTDLSSLSHSYCSRKKSRGQNCLSRVLSKGFSPRINRVEKGCKTRMEKRKLLLFWLSSGNFYCTDEEEILSRRARVVCLLALKTRAWLVVA